MFPGHSPEQAQSGGGESFSRFTSTAGRSMRVMPRNARELFVVSKNSATSNEGEAVRAFRSIPRTDPAIRHKLFLEGTRNESSDRVTAELGVPVCGINSGTLSALYWPMAASSEFLNLCRVASANGNPNYPNAAAIMNEARGLAAAFQLAKGVSPRFPIGMDMVQESILANLAYSVSFVGEFYPVSAERLRAAILEMPETDSGKIPPGIGSILKGLLGTMSVQKIAEFNALSAEAAGALSLPVRKFSESLLPKILFQIERNGLEKAYQDTEAGFRQIRAVREDVFAYHIAREEFDRGVLNCSFYRTTSESFAATLERFGVRLRPVRV